MESRSGHWPGPVAEQVCSGPCSGPWLGIRCELVTLSVARLGPGEVQRERRGKRQGGFSGRQLLSPVGVSGPLSWRQALGAVVCIEPWGPWVRPAGARRLYGRDSYAHPRCKGVRRKGGPGLNHGVGDPEPAATCIPLGSWPGALVFPGLGTGQAGRAGSCGEWGPLMLSSAVVLQPREGLARQQPDPEHGPCHRGRHHPAGQQLAALGRHRGQSGDGHRGWLFRG